MARYEISLTMLATVTIDADNAADAMREARRFAEASGPQDGFIDGWNSGQAIHDRTPRVVDMTGPDVEGLTPDDVEEVAADDDAYNMDGSACDEGHQNDGDDMCARCGVNLHAT